MYINNKKKKDRLFTNYEVLVKRAGFKVHNDINRCIGSYHIYLQYIIYVFHKHK